MERLRRLLYKVKLREEFQKMFGERGCAEASEDEIWNYFERTGMGKLEISDAIFYAQLHGFIELGDEWADEKDYTIRMWKDPTWTGRGERKRLTRELKRELNDLFRHYKRKEVTKEEFYSYFRSKGYDEGDIARLLYMAEDLSLLLIGFRPNPSAPHKLTTTIKQIV